MAKPQYPSEKLDQYMLRFPDGMRDQLKFEAAKNGRSLNAEIILRLEDSLIGRRESSSIDEIATLAVQQMMKTRFAIGSADLERFHSKYEEIKNQEARAKTDLLRLVEDIMKRTSGDQFETE